MQSNLFWFIAGAIFELLATAFLMWLGRKSAREINLRS